MNSYQKRYSDLLKNILLFSHLLRKRKVGVTTDNILDVLKGISFINIQDKMDFYHLLISNFVSSKEEMEAFDELFKNFWTFDEISPQNLNKMLEEEFGDSGEEKDEISFEYEKVKTLFEEWVDDKEEPAEREEREIPAYSPEEILRRKDFNELEKDELSKIKEWVLNLSRRMAMNLSRRWKRGKRGDQLDFRRTIRQSIKYGGELIELRMREQKKKPIRLILLCDVSGSMDIYSQFFILLMYGLQNYYPYCETFTFSTRLSYVTPLLKRRAFEEALHLLSENVLDWSGGTNIGGAIYQFHRFHSELLLPNRTYLLIFSDGWDRGDTSLLDSELKNLKREVKKLIWLNPLLGSKNYQPICKGMSTALPYLDHFLPLNNFSSLKNLSQIILKS